MANLVRLRPSSKTCDNAQLDFASSPGTEPMRCAPAMHRERQPSNRMARAKNADACHRLENAGCGGLGGKNRLDPLRAGAVCSDIHRASLIASI
jgi:hypothetical protein